MKLPPHIRNPDPEILMSDSYVVVDVETTNLEKGNASIADNDLLLTCMKFSDRDKVQVFWGNEFETYKLLDTLSKYTLLVAHNTKMELKWLARCGMDLSKVVPYCTMIGEYVLTGNIRVPLGLGPISDKYGFGQKDTYVDILMKSGVCPRYIPRSLLQDRCIKDVYQTELIFLEQRKRLKKAGLIPCAFTRNIFTPVLADIELKGMQLDPERVYKLHDEAVRKRDEVATELKMLIGDVNTNSPKQMAELLYGELKFKEVRDHRGKVRKTKSGAPMTGSDIIAKLDAKTKKQIKFKELWKDLAVLEADISKALAKFKDCCDEDGGLLYANFNQTVTATTRLSSSGVKHNVQFQNLARKFKSLFMSRYEDWNIGEIDGAQIEFRVAGYLGQDHQIYEDLVNEADIHKFTASAINDVPEDQVTKELRTAAKADTFKPLDIAA